jgi:cytochrome c biogenesis protein CcdA
MKRLKYVLLFAALFLLIVPGPTGNAEGDACVYFFYGEGCRHCAAVAPVIGAIEAENSGMVVHRFEVYGNRDNLLLLNEYFDAYGVPQEERGIPAVFVSDRYLVGDTPILTELEPLVTGGGAAACPSLDVNVSASGSSGGSSPAEALGGISLLTVIGAAAVDSINPCAIAVLLILLTALIAAGERKRALKAGLAFTASIYIAYFLFGLGLFSALQVTGLSFWFYKAVGFIAIAIGLANLKDYFWYAKGGFVMEIPRSWRPSLKKILGGVTTPAGAFLSGFVVCLFELPCTGGPYIFILGLLAERATQALAVPVLLLYNVFFVLPLLVITVAVYLGRTDVGKAGEWKERNIRKLHLAAGVVMLLLGVAVVMGIA